MLINNRIGGTGAWPVELGLRLEGGGTRQRWLDFGCGGNSSEALGVPARPRALAGQLRVGHKP